MIMRSTLGTLILALALASCAPEPCPAVGDDEAANDEDCAGILSCTTDYDCTHAAK